jgi:hypothetical protein
MSIINRLSEVKVHGGLTLTIDVESIFVHYWTLIQ